MRDTNIEKMILAGVEAALYVNYIRASIGCLPCGIAGTILFCIAMLALMSFAASAVHEAGHLAGGLLTGYHLLIFRVYWFSLVRRQGAFHVQIRPLLARRDSSPVHYAAGGFTSQCLMAPGRLKGKRPAYTMYQMGGLFFNLVSGAAVAYAAYEKMDHEGVLFLLLYAYETACVCKLISNGVPVYLHRYPANDIAVQAALELDRDTQKEYIHYLNCLEDVLDGRPVRKLPVQTGAHGKFYCDLFRKKSMQLQRMAADRPAD